MAGRDLLFASWAQTPIGAAIDHPDDGAPLPPPTFSPGITLIAPDASTTTATGPALAVLGPGAITGLDPRVVRRLDPPDGATAVEPNYLASIELTPVELPWLFTPASPGPHDRLRPWLVLVVVEVASSTVVDGPGLPLLQVGVEELPDLADSWAWAHVQVPPDPPPPLPPGVPPVVGTAVARLVCPRRLTPDTAYRACLVPAFAGGVSAGGGTVTPGTPETAPAWDVGVAGTRVGLPVLTGWQFATGAFGDFEMLVRRLEPADPALLDRLGLATVDVSDPWHDGAAAPTTAPRPTVDVPGALQSFEVTPGGTVTAQQRHDFVARLCAQLDAPALRVAVATDPDPDPGDDTTGAVAPPIYGGRHAVRDQIVAPPAGTSGVGWTGDWVDQLNRDYAARIAAGLGAHYVAANVEQLMTHAWDQVGAIREANRRRHLGELGAAAGESLHRRHILPLTAGEAVGVAATTSGRTPVTTGGSTLRTEVLVSPLPDGAATGAFARLLRPSGPVARRAGTRAADIVTRGLGGGVTVPRPGPLLARLPVTTVAAAASPLGRVSAEAVTRGVTDAAAQGSVVLQAVADVARTNGFAAQAAAIDAAVAGLGIAPGDLRSGDLTAVRSAVANSLPAVDSVFTAAIATLTAPAAAGFTAPAVVAAPTAYGVPVDAAGLAGRLAGALRPTDRIGRRVAAAVTVPPAWTTPTPLDTVLADPTFDLPAAFALLGDAPEWFLPGVGDLPAERVVLLEPNASFVEAYLVGMAQRLNSELRWQEYPTDLRGTPFSRFWPRSDVGSDIAPITTWTGALGSHLDATGASVVVLLVRGSSPASPSGARSGSSSRRTGWWRGERAGRAAGRDDDRHTARSAAGRADPGRPAGGDRDRPARRRGRAAHPRRRPAPARGPAASLPERRGDQRPGSCGTRDRSPRHLAHRHRRRRPAGRRHRPGRAHGRPGRLRHGSRRRAAVVQHRSGTARAPAAGPAGDRLPRGQHGRRRAVDPGLSGRHPHRQPRTGPDPRRGRRRTELLAGGLGGGT